MADASAQGYPLELLLKVRQHREDDARRADEQARQAVRQAQAAVETALQGLENYQRWRTDEETRRYAAILGKELEKKGLDDFRAGLAALIEKEVLLEDEVRQARESLQARMREAEQTAKKLRQAVKDSARIQEHRQVWREEERRNVEYREEKEVEP